MTVIKQSRKKLDDALADKALTVLLISDDVGTKAEEVHDVADNLLKSGQEVILVTDLGVLTASEKKRWFDDGGHYAVIGGVHRVVGVRGILSELLLSDAKKTPSPIEIRAALAKGDSLP